MSVRYIFFILFVFCISLKLQAQNLYTADGYWIEFKKNIYQEILSKQSRGESLSENEANYLIDYGAYLQQYFSRLSEEEKTKVEEMMDIWSFEKRDPGPVDPAEEDFDLRTRDRLVNGIWGAYYGASIVVVAGIEEGGLTAGIPLIMAGAWQLGPVINKQKYENISLATIRAGNAGKFLGAGYGAAAGLALAGDSEDNAKWILGLSTIGSIALGEMAFQTQKSKQIPIGQVEMTRHYGLLGPISTGLIALAIDPENPQLIGGALLAGGIGGLFVGRNVSRKYDYTQGDVDVVSSLSLISAGLGGTIAVGTIDNDGGSGLLVIPAITAVAGSIFGQKSVKGVRLNKKQGSTIKLASGGAALIGLGTIALTESDAPALYVGAASVCGLVMHQILFHSYKKKNLERRFDLGRNSNSRMQFAFNVTPENYLINKSLSKEMIYRNPTISYPIVDFKLRF